MNDITSKGYRTSPKPSGVPDITEEKGLYRVRVCSNGAGVAHLYTAMMLKFLEATNVDILEASDRVGGRCFTQALSGDKSYHNYYDVRAMRIQNLLGLGSKSLTP